MDRNLAEEHTFLGLTMMKQNLFEKAGRIIVSHAVGNDSDLEHYIEKLDKLDGHLFRKLNQIEDADKASDLMIMREKTKVLNNYMKSLSKVNHNIPQSMRRSGATTTPASPSKPLSGYMDNGVRDRYGRSF